MDDPIFIQIRDLEQRGGKPPKFKDVQQDMIKGNTGSMRIEDAIRSIPKGDFQDGVMLTTVPATYYYTSINNSVYAFAFNLADSDKLYRRASYNISSQPVNFFANLQAYNSTDVIKVCCIFKSCYT